MIRFSRRTNWDTTETEWARQIRERRVGALPILDLTASNPTQCGFKYNDREILSALQDPGSMSYHPDPKGLLSTRTAVAEYYSGLGAAIDPNALVLTASTSEGYSFLFRLLCDPEDEVLIAAPSYPLFDFLADVNDVRLVSYSLFYDHGWHLDLESLRRAVTPRTRAVVVVHPNNPTGHFTKAAERTILEAICLEHGMALIVDEVFLDYPVAPAEPVTSFSSGEHPVLTFVLSGLSKIAGLPQMKAAWIGCFGPEPQFSAALGRLEVIADTFLSMNAPVQLAVPQWLAGRERIQEQIRARTATNLRILDQWLSEQKLVVHLPVEGGWYAILRVPAKAADNETALNLLVRYGVAVHSG
ncbi:MAG: pyridoxal phosphate-dependent aminotransferase, partial [Acetobacteraceae bacterium]|nr:pyridoxal phosphate-dependent aminotransferase [Acetobacteraceae bacterium]